MRRRLLCMLFILLPSILLAEVEKFVITEKLPAIKQQKQPDRQRKVAPDDKGKNQGSTWSPSVTTVVDSRQGYPLRKTKYWSHPKFRTTAEFVQHLRSGVHAGHFTGYAIDGYTWAELESCHSDDHDGILKPPIQIEMRRSVTAIPLEPFLGATWDMSAVNAVTEAPPPEPRVINIYTSTSCPACVVLKKNLKDGDHRVRFNYLVGTHPSNTHGTVPFLHDPLTDKRAWGAAYKTVDQVITAFGISPQTEAVGGIPAGTIDRKTLDLIVSYFRPRPGSHNGGNDEIHYTGSVTVKIPKDLKAEWSTANGVTTIRFTGNRPLAEWGMISQRIDGIMISENQVTLMLPRMFDLDLKVQ